MSENVYSLSRVKETRKKFSIYKLKAKETHFALKVDYTAHLRYLSFESVALLDPTVHSLFILIGYDYYLTS